MITYSGSNLIGKRVRIHRDFQSAMGRINSYAGQCSVKVSSSILDALVEIVLKESLTEAYCVLIIQLMLLRPRILIVYRKEDLNCVRVFFNKPSLILTISYFTYYHLTLIILR